MVYMGSKNRIAKDIIPIVTRYLTKDKWYVEPFCGGCNMIDKIKHPKRIASDSNRYLIALFKELQNGREFPKEISKEEYQRVRNNKDKYPDWYVGFVGFLCSFRGKFFNGFISPICDTKDGVRRNYQNEQKNNFLKQRDYILDVIFYDLEYHNLDLAKGSSVIYCDPPYQGTTEYKDSFDHESFWDWVRYQTKNGNDVLVSEYNAPTDFVCVWSKGINMNLHGGNGRKAVEKLFVHESIADKYIDNKLF